MAVVSVSALREPRRNFNPRGQDSPLPGLLLLLPSTNQQRFAIGLAFLVGVLCGRLGSPSACWTSGAAAAIGTIGTISTNDNNDNDNDNNNEIDSVIIRLGRFARAWIGSWFLSYDSRKLRYRLELIADRRVPHVMLYAPKTTIVESVAANASPAAPAATATASRTTTSRMEPFVNEALNANVRVRLYEYVSGEGDNGGEEHVRLLLDDVGEHAGLEVHQNVRYLMENLCGKPTANQFTCL